MSSILKALKKLEDEKTARKPDSLNIDAEILRGDTSSRRSPLWVSLMAALIFVCGGGATYLIMNQGLSGRQPSQSAMAPQLNTPSTPINVSATTNDTAGHRENAPADSVQLVQSPSAQKKQKTVVPATPPSAPAKQPVAKSSPKAQPDLRPKAVVAARPTTPAQQEASAGVRTAAPLVVPVVKVNGIAFQEGGSDSVAVVNGISVSNGSMIEGARIEEIQRDRVRFSYSGEKFEVMLGKTNR
jgi:general secretion pathway protein B